MGIKTGLIMCQDINLTDTATSCQAAIPHKKLPISEIMGLDSSLGVFSLEEDGSFYLKVMADKPFQIRLWMKKEMLFRACDWIWLRPNERRGCVGCHEDQELVPENRIPLAVKKAPVKIPII